MLSRLHLEIPKLHFSIRSGDRFKFEKIYDHYAPALYGWILKRIPDIKTAEEILCSSFLYVAKNIKEYNPEKCGFLIWLIQISNKEIQKHNNRIENGSPVIPTNIKSAQISIQTGA